MAVVFIAWYALEGTASIKSVAYILAISIGSGLLWGWSMFAIMEVKYRHHDATYRRV